MTHIISGTQIKRKNLTAKIAPIFELMKAQKTNHLANLISNLKAPVTAITKPGHDNNVKCLGRGTTTVDGFVFS
jgi:hypothetical protein